METTAFIVAVFAIWAALAVAAGWLFPPGKGRRETMEEMMNDGAKSSLHLLELGVVSIAIVLSAAVAFDLL
jgi:hypothetical protein